MIRTRTAFLPLAALVVALGALFFAATASAAPFEEIDPPGFKCSDTAAGACANTKLTVDEATGDVFLVDIGNDRVLHFDSEGALLSEIKGSETAHTSFEFFGEENDVAVDPSSGNLYVESEAAGIFAFEPEVAEPSGYKEIWHQEAFTYGGDPCGVAVDASGNPWVGDYNAGVQQVSVANGSTVGSPVAIDHASGFKATTCEIAFDASNNLYVAIYHSSLYKYASGDYTTSSATIDGGPVYDVATDSTTGDVYADYGVEHINAYDSTGTPLAGSPFASSDSPIGVTVDGPHGRIYVSGSGETIHVYATANAATPKPYVRTEGASGQTATTADIAGKVNPAGATVSRANCLVEYGTTTALGSSTECSTEPGSGTAQVPVQAELTGLTPGGTTYYYRVKATNANGTTKGALRSFSTLNPTLKVVLGGNGQGSVQCNSGSGFGACAPSYAAGTAITLKAAANTGNVLGGWLGDCEPTGNDCALTLNEDTRITAVFLKEGTQGSTGPTGPAGSNGSNGTQGPAGSNGSNGAKGETGATGPAGPQGKEGPAAKVTCKVKGSKKPKVTCTVKQGASASASKVHWRLSRAGHTFRRGTSAQGRLALGALPPGHYRLQIAGSPGSTPILVG